MPRQRGKSQTAQQVAETPTATQATSNKTNGGTSIMTSLQSVDASELQSILAGSRTKGAGTDVLREFIESNEPIAEVDLTTGALAGKEPGQAYTTLTNAKKRTVTDSSGATVLAMPEAKNVKVIKRNLGSKDTPEFHIYLVDQTKVEL